MNQPRTSTQGSINFRNPPNMMNGISQPMGVPGVSTTSGIPGVPPPVPPRRPVSTYQSNYSPYNTSLMSNYGYGSGWSPMGMSRYGFGSSYNPYNSGYSMYGNQWGGPSGDVENRFVQYAEESTRPAFQSIETMVHTFSSVTMMLESTFFAMTNSFRAILGVAENMGKLRATLKQVLGSFALFRFIKWLYLRVKYTLGIRNQDTNSELLWRETISEIMRGDPEENRSSSWPIFLFLGILFATPYLIHRLVNNNVASQINVNNPKEWLQSKEPVRTALALYDFVPASAAELPLKTGQKVWIAPQSLQPDNLPGWCRATDNIKVGLIPATYITIVGQLAKKSECNQPQAPNIQQPVVSDIYQPSVINENIPISEENEESLISKEVNNIKDNFETSKDAEIFELKNDN